MDFAVIVRGVQERAISGIERGSVNNMLVNYLFRDLARKRSTHFLLDRLEPQRDLSGLL